MRHFNRANARYPGLWRGCIGAWAPSLQGPSGSSLRDWSGYSKNGTIVTLDPATGWNIQGGKFCLGPFSSTASVTTGVYSGLPAAGPMAVSLWVLTTASTAFLHLIGERNVSAYNWQVRFGSAGAFSFLSGAGVATNGSVPTNNQFNHLAMSMDSTGVVKLFINGTLNATSASGQTLGTNALYKLTIGNQMDGTQPMGGHLDDVRLYNRNLTDAEIRLLSVRRGIAYETTRDRHYKSSAGFKPHWASQRTQIISGGTR